jgi:Zn-dependent protease with chaperone function
MRGTLIFVAAGLAVSGAASAQLRDLKPGWNLFSPQQDIQLGKEASTQIQQKLPLVHNQELDDYLSALLARLAKSPRAGTYPYTIHAVYDKNINAFSLPGGPIYVNTGLISMADNEAQLAGVIAHEMSHVYLRHATNQVSKQNALSIPAMLAGAVVGNGIFGQLTRAGLGLGAHSVLLSFSRGDEAQADYNGAEIMADAGYNPIEMANFFEKLEAQGGRQGHLSQFLSDHPNPGNRVTAVQDEIRRMPRRSFGTDSGQFPHIKDVVFHLGGPGRLQGSNYTDGHTPSAPSARPSRTYKTYRGNAYSLSYPDNWQAYGDQQGNAVTIAPREGIVQGQGETVGIGYGLEVSYYFPQGDRIDLSRDTEALLRQLESQNAGMRVTGPSSETTIAGQRALVTTLTSKSAFEGETEFDTVVTIPRPEGLFYMVLIAPESERAYAQAAFDEILRSVRFS